MKKLPLHALALFMAAILSVFTACSGGGGGSDDAPIDVNACGEIGLTTKIINGVQCQENNSPIAQLLLSSGDSTFLCSGSLIAPNIILTAAHCFTTEQIDSVSVKVGTQSASGIQVVIHPDAQDTDTAYFNDVALLKLDRSLSGPILPLLLSQAVVEDDLIAIHGYGLDDDDNQGILTSGRMRVNGVSSNHISATYEGDESDPCFGDSGGPAVFSYSAAAGILYGVVGIVSTGTSDDCSAGDYNLFTNVQQPQIYGFIQQNVPNVTIR